MKALAATLILSFLTLAIIVCASPYMSAGNTTQIMSGMSDMPMSGFCTSSSGTPVTCSSTMNGFEMVAHHAMMFGIFTNAMTIHILLVILSVLVGAMGLFVYTRCWGILKLHHERNNTYIRSYNKIKKIIPQRHAQLHWISLLEVSPTHA